MTAYKAIHPEILVKILARNLIEIRGKGAPLPTIRQFFENTVKEKNKKISKYYSKLSKFQTRFTSISENTGKIPKIGNFVRVELFAAKLDI